MITLYQGTQEEESFSDYTPRINVIDRIKALSTYEAFGPFVLKRFTKGKTTSPQQLPDPKLFEGLDGIAMVPYMLPTKRLLVYGSRAIVLQIIAGFIKIWNDLPASMPTFTRHDDNAEKYPKIISNRRDLHLENDISPATENPVELVIIESTYIDPKDIRYHDFDHIIAVEFNRRDFPRFRGYFNGGL